VEELRTEVARLQRERDEARAQNLRKPGSKARVLRWTASIVLLVLLALLAFTTVPAFYLRTQLLDTDRYVATVAPLAADPAIQSEIADKVTNQITGAVDIQGITKDALDDLGQAAPRVASVISGLAPVLSQQTTDLIHSAVADFVAAPEFQDLWTRVNREAHQAVVSAASGSNDGAVSISDTGEITLSTKDIIDGVKANLTQRGVGIASQIPSIDGQITVAQAPALPQILTAINTFDKLSPLLGWLTALCAVGAVAVAPAGARRRATGLAGLSIAAGMALLAIALVVGRFLYLDAIPPDSLSPAAAESLFDTVLEPLRTTLRLVFVVGLLIAIAVFLAGRSSAAIWIRQGFARAGDYLTGRIGAHEVKPWQRMLARHRRVIEAAVIGIAALVLILWQYPTAAVAIWTAVITAVVILAVELLCRPAIVTPHPTGPAPDQVSQAAPGGQNPAGGQDAPE